MPEINNSLAAQIQVPQTDAIGTFGKISQFQKLQADTALTQQLTALKRSQLRGQAANEIVQDPSDEGVNRAFQHFEQNGVPLDNLTKQRMLAQSPEQRKATAAQIVAGSMEPSTYVEQSGIPAGNVAREAGRYTPYPVPPNAPIINRTAAAMGGISQPAPTTGGRPPIPSSASIMGDDEAVRNGLYSPTPEQIKRGVTGPAAPSFNDRFKGDMFTPSVVRGPDGSISSSVTPATLALQEQATKQYEKSGENANAAQNLSMRLDMMDHSADVLNTTGWSSTGAGANAKLGAAKSVNSLLQTVGLPPAVDPTKISNWEDLNKETTRAGFDLARTLGSREAAAIVQSSVSAVPSAENTATGFKLVSSGIRQAVQREKDFYQFATDYAKTHRGNTFGADVEFNKQFPPQLYAKTAIANAIPPGAITLMKGDPKLSDKFDEKYGPGMAAFVLHHDQAR